MSGDYFARLARRLIGSSAVLRPRLPSRFEDGGVAVGMPVRGGLGDTFAAPPWGHELEQTASTLSAPSAPSRPAPHQLPPTASANAPAALDGATVQPTAQAQRVQRLDAALAPALAARPSQATSSLAWERSDTAAHQHVPAPQAAVDALPRLSLHGLPALAPIDSLAHVTSAFAAPPRADSARPEALQPRLPSVHQAITPDTGLQHTVASLVTGFGAITRLDMGTQQAGSPSVPSNLAPPLRQQAEPPVPQVEIHIGRIELMQAAPAAEPARPAQPSPQVPAPQSLDAYLAKRQRS